ncbi:MAG TPA: D-glucuronyl C5-epimerase family protein [Solirubrobacteraceae bacterium]|nr:D-glucuronyl C5-epimerase family protein [Solirubrobacteraceae bacterium]
MLRPLVQRARVRRNLLSTLALSGAVAALLIPAQAGARGPSVTAALSSLKSSGAIAEAAYRQYTAAYAAANSSLKKLSGTRRAELGAVIANTQGMAAAGAFIPTRLPVIFLTLEKNRQWWTTQPLVSSRVRVSFPPSKLVWEYYAGQGIQIQWLGTFGEANGYYLSGHENTNLRQLLSEVLPLATKRAGGIAWEYMFHFDGGSPPWTSGLSQGTALQVMARAWSRFKEPAYLTAAQQALGIFQTAPATGVHVKTAAGAEYAEYTYAPSDRILNGFIQADVGLYDYTSITHDPLGLRLFEEGDAEARAEVPHYDTGAWSMYDQYGESDLNYHELLTEFLQHLCERTRKGPPAATAVTPAPSPTPSPSPTPTPAPPGGGSSETGGASAAMAVARVPERLQASAKGAQAPIAGDEIYCTTAQHFTTDLRTPPIVSLITTTLRSGSRAGVQVSLSKIATVKISIKRSGRMVWSNGATVERGKPKILWTTPSQTGAYQVTITATDLAGNFSTANGTIVLSKH